jgi:hypothetical protein
MTSRKLNVKLVPLHDTHLKLGEHSGTYIETIFSVGYRFQPSRIEPPVVVP